jgi:hypothetical protein
VWFSVDPLLSPTPHVPCRTQRSHTSVCLCMFASSFISRTRRAPSQNAALQCLSYSPPLGNFLALREHSAKCRVGGQNGAFCTLCAMEKLQQDLIHAPGNHPHAPQLIVRNIKAIGSRFRQGRQEDSHEFIRLILEAMHKNTLLSFPGVTDERVKETSAIHRIFGGYLRSQVKCLKCHTASNKYDAILVCPEMSKRPRQTCVDDVQCDCRGGRVPCCVLAPCGTR